MSAGSNAGNFKISAVPLTPASPRKPAREEPAGLPQHYGAPLLFAMARNPRTLFACWSVDWPAAFGSEAPPDRRAHLKLTSRSRQRMEAVELLCGHCSIGDLEPGETYAIELGYFAPAEKWNVIASDEVMMSGPGLPNKEGSIDVATVPFHLSFQRLADLFGGGDALTHTLGEWEKRTGQSSLLSERDEQLLRALGLSANDLKTAKAIPEALMNRKPQTRAPDYFSGSSWSSRS
jgi:hypothetical protein